MKNQTIYIGKTIDMKKRISNHFSKRSHLANTNLYSEIQRIEYMKLPNEFEALKYELYFINLYKPKYNTDSKIKSFIEHDPTIKEHWNVYKIIKEIPIEQHKQNEMLSKYLPVIMVIFFISIIVCYFIY